MKSPLLFYVNIPWFKGTPNIEAGKQFDWILQERLHILSLRMNYFNTNVVLNKPVTDKALNRNIQLKKLYFQTPDGERVLPIEQLARLR